MNERSFGQEARNTAARTFAALVAAKVEVFRELCSGRENTEVTGEFIEQLLREYINSWLSPMGIFPGSLWCSSASKMMQIDGLIWQPSFGPPLLKQDNLLLLHPNTVRAVVEIKTSLKNARQLHNRLHELWTSFLYPACHAERDALGIILWHDSPETASNPKWHRVEGHRVELHTLALHAHPIFILFRRKGDFEYEPFMPAIEAMLLKFNHIANTPQVNTLI